jgi:hypothetical protein
MVGKYFHNSAIVASGGLGTKFMDGFIGRVKDLKN